MNESMTHSLSWSHTALNHLGHSVWQSQRLTRTCWIWKCPNYEQFACPSVCSRAAAQVCLNAGLIRAFAWVWFPPAQLLALALSAPATLPRTRISLIHHSSDTGSLSDTHLSFPPFSQSDQDGSAPLALSCSFR